MAHLVTQLVSAALLMALVLAGDAGPINDFCVADLMSTMMHNGLACKNPMNVTSEDFAFREFRSMADTNNSLGIGIIPGFAGVNYGALNTQGFALAKFNYAKGGLVPPHTHPRAAELIMVLRGEVYVGFVDTTGKLFATKLKQGDVFLFPQGLVHFQLNTASNWSTTVSVLNAQSPGVQMLPSALFGAMPAMDTKILAKAFGISRNQTEWIKKGFMPPSM